MNVNSCKLLMNNFYGFFYNAHIQPTSLQDIKGCRGCMFKKTKESLVKQREITIN